MASESEPRAPARGTGPGAELLRLGRELASTGDAQVGGGFSGHPEADALLESSPEAFLIGVLFTQGIPAERAWAGPWLLRERLGHFDLTRLAGERAAVADAVAAPPALHRFIHTLPGWICDAAERVLSCYNGDASTIWAPGLSVAEVTNRLTEFRGIGPKKATMAVEILRRHFRVPLTGVEDGSVAYDVHVRRVFLRTGLVDADTPDAVRAAAAAVCPDDPGMLDLATWLVGRTTCRPSHPQCDSCQLGHVCARLTCLDARGVGVRRQSSERSSSPESSFG